MILQSDEFTDLTWDSNNGQIYTDVTGCSSGSGNSYIREIATISLSIYPRYSFTTYYGCDYIVYLQISETGNLYIISSYEFEDVVMQKTPINRLLQSEWVYLPDAWTGYHLHLRMSE